MSDQSMPEDWSTGHPPNVGDASSQMPSQLPGTPGSQNPEDAGAIYKRIPRQKFNSALPKTNSELPASDSSSELTAQGSSWTESSLPPTGKPSIPGDPKRHKWWKNWMLWAALAALSFNGVAFIAVAVLLKLPSAPNCPAIFWPLASGAVRLHCAQVAASKQTVSDLLEAITLVKGLPQNHPMRADIDRYLQQWSQDILALAEEEFQAGNLNGAIATANKIPQEIPQNIAATNSALEQISKWRSLWSQAESIYTGAEAEIPKQHWHQAFMTAVRLLNVGNEYWENTKYDELKYKIESARVDGGKLEQAEALAKQPSVKNFLAALKLVNSVDKDSYMYQKAQELIPDFGRKMLKLAQTNLDRKNADEAIAIANQIPPIPSLEMEVQDFITIAQAKRSAFAGTVPSIETAIMTAQKLATDRPLYNQAQELIARWQLEIEDVQHLDKGRGLAQPGTVADLNAAIAEVSMIPENNPRIKEARLEINRWQAQIQTFEDQPYLDRAEQIALSGQVSDLQSAVNEASQITKGRALYREAREKIRNWTRQIETIEDQPYLDQARDLANSGNLPAAITAAQQIRPGRALSGDAQAAVRDWQEQIQAQQNWREAQQMAQQGTPDALVEAMRLADKVPRSNSLRSDVNPALSEWGHRLLVIAQDRGRYDIPGAIAIAQKIPRSSDAYREARVQIGEWDRILNPPPPPPPSPEPSPEAGSVPNSINPQPNPTQPSPINPDN